MPMSLAVPDWETRIREGRSLIPDVARTINPPKVERIRKMLGRLRLPDVIGKPTFADACGPWFIDIASVFLGGVDAVTAARILVELFLLAPKKSSKTTYGAGMMLTALVDNMRPNGEFLFTGPTQDIAEIAYGAAVGMIDADDEAQRAENGREGYLKTILHTRDHLKKIEHRKTDASLSIKTFDMDVATGVKPVGVLVDELHIIAKNRNAMRVLGQLRGGLISNPEAFFATITTQSDEPPVGAMESALKVARDVRDGATKGDTLSILYEFPPDIVKAARPGEKPAWYNSALWPMVTPNLNRSVTIDVLEREFEKAIQKGEAEIRRWASQHLNIEIGLALRSDRWTGADYWEACADPSITFEEILRRCEIVVAGIDGGGLDDLLGLAVLGRDRETREWLLWTHAWAHKSVLERRKDIESALRDFEKDGDLTIVENVGDDVEAVADYVEQIEQAGLLPEKLGVGVDQMGISEIVDALGQRNIVEERIGGVPQGWKLNNAIKTMERRLAAGAGKPAADESENRRGLRHCGSRMMAWCLGNAKAEPKGNAITISKQISGSAKIDPLMAAFDATVVMGLNPEGSRAVPEVSVF